MVLVTLLNFVVPAIFIFILLHVILAYLLIPFFQLKYNTRNSAGVAEDLAASLRMWLQVGFGREPC